MRADVTQAAGKSNAAIACEVSAAITSSLVLEDVLADVARRLTEALDVWECDLYEYYPENATVVVLLLLVPRDDPGGQGLDRQGA